MLKFQCTQKILIELYNIRIVEQSILIRRMAEIVHLPYTGYLLQKADSQFFMNRTKDRSGCNEGDA